MVVASQAFFINVQSAAAETIDAASIKGIVTYGRFREFIGEKLIKSVTVSDDGR
jgi:hypothetical protein